MVLYECVFLLQCGTAPVIVTRSLLFSLIISQPENYVVFSFEMHCLAGVNKARMLEKTGVGQVLSIAGHGLGMGWPWASWGAIDTEKMHHQKWHFY